MKTVSRVLVQKPKKVVTAFFFFFCYGPIYYLYYEFMVFSARVDFCIAPNVASKDES